MHEYGSYILTVIIILTILTIFVGFLFKQPLSSPFSYLYFFKSINVKNNNYIFSQNEYFLFFILMIKKIIFIIPIFGFIFSFLFFNFGLNNYYFNEIKNNYMRYPLLLNNNYYYLYLFWYCLQAKGLIDYVYNKLIVRPVLIFSYKICYIELD